MKKNAYWWCFFSYFSLCRPTSTKPHKVTPLCIIFKKVIYKVTMEKEHKILHQLDRKRNRKATVGYIKIYVSNVIKGSLLSILRSKKEFEVHRMQREKCQVFEKLSLKEGNLKNVWCNYWWYVLSEFHHGLY